MNGDERRVVKRMDSVRDCTVDDLIDWCVERGISPWDATVTSAHVKWESPETEEERVRREGWETDRRARTEKWEREMLERLAAKYGRYSAGEGEGR